jgi:hypothetical protein
MARLISREFDPTRPTYARRKFIANGRRYASGDLFDWRRVSLTERKAKQMFDSGHLGHQDNAPAPAPVVETPVILKAINEPADTPVDDLDAIDDMKELRLIADAEGAPYKVSKTDQRQAIRDNRKESI